MTQESFNCVKAGTRGHTGSLRISNSSGPTVKWLQNNRRIWNFGCDSEL